MRALPRREELGTPGARTRSRSPSPDVGAERRRGRHGGDLLGLQRAAGNRAVAGILTTEAQGHAPGGPGGPASLWVQRAWKPATTSGATTLRTGPADNQPRVGAELQPGTQLIADRAQQVTEPRRIRKDAVWTRAANVAPAAWDISQAATVAYVRDARLGPDVPYPQTNNRFAVPKRSAVRTERRWSEHIGEYVWVEPSPRGGSVEIVRTAAGFQSFSPPATLAALNADEDYFVDVDRLEANMRTRLSAILTAASHRIGLAANLLDKPKHVTDLMKPLNYTQALVLDSAAFRNWYTWKEGVFATITTGANFMVDALDHWRQSLYPANPAQVTVNDVRMSASDLHEQGLGVIMVDFQKPPGGPPGHPFSAKTAFTAVIKPEERGIEKALFGTEATSLANRLNRLANLGGADTISTIKMVTHQQYGALIEFIAGTAARDLDRAQPTSQAMIEAMAMAYVAGLSDVHRDNVLYVGGRPYLIDADNALNNARIGLTAHPTAEVQSGFSQYNEQDELAERTNIKSAPGSSASAIMQALVDNGNPVPVVDAVRKTFTGKTGRVVPIATSSWATPLRNIYPGHPTGAATDAPSGNTTRWALCNMLASRVPAGTPGTPQPGLEGETGIANAGRFFNQAAEAAEIKSDYDEGKIPFFNYEYDTGHVKHNGVLVWHGAPLAEVLEKLLTRFPHQRNITDI